MSNSVKALLQRSGELADGSPTPRLDLELLLCHVLGKERSYLFSWPEHQLSPEQYQQFETLLEQRKQGHPVAYLTGRRDFWNLELRVEPSTLIPRPDTETLVEIALKLCDQRPRKVLDLGTGTGAIALALASERPGWIVTGCDRIAAAVALAQSNAALHKLERVSFILSNWFSALAGQKFDLIVSNPPYIVDNDPHLLTGDVRFEPTSALISGPDGLEDIRHITQQAPQHLKDLGYLIMEHGYHQGAEVRSIVHSHGFINVTTVADLAGHERVTFGQYRQAGQQDNV